MYLGRNMRSPRQPNIRTPRRDGRLIVAAVLATVAVWSSLVGCAVAPVALRPQPRSFTARDYERVYRTWTRDADEFAYGRLSDVLNVTATFQSWEHRWAYVVRYAADYGLATEERTDLLRASLADAQQHHRFFVTLSGQRFRESDLTGPLSAWRVVLVDEHGRQTVPVETSKIDRPSVAERSYFPTISPHRQAFRLTFPARRPDGTETIPADAEFTVLRFTGPLGTVDLRWDYR